jgi:hypothetical protein
MAKRFTDSEKWKDDWFQALSPKMKLAWIYLCDECDSAGVWRANFPLMSFCVGEKIDRADLDPAFEDRVLWLSESRLWVHGFIAFQYRTLNPRNTAHRGMMRTLVALTESLPLGDKLNFLIQSFKKSIGCEVDPQPTLDRGSTEGQSTLQVKEKVKVKEKGFKKGGVGENKTLPPLAMIWNSHRRNLPEAKGCSGQRRKGADERWREKPETEYWANIVRRIADSEFCNGKNDRGWKADLDFLIRPDTQHKVLEGKYDNRGGQGEFVDPEILKLRRQAAQEDEDRRKNELAS